MGPVESVRGVGQPPEDRSLGTGSLDLSWSRGAPSGEKRSSVSQWTSPRAGARKVTWAQQTPPGCAEAHPSLGPGGLTLTGVFLSDPKRFTQSMKLDGELGRLMLEHGTMLGPPTEAERAEERTRKELARKVCFVRHRWACSLAGAPAAALHSSFG